MLREHIEITSWPHHDRPHLSEGDELAVVPEPDNAYDESAIALYKGRSKVGYIPADITWKVHEALDAGKLVEVEVMWPYQEDLGIMPHALVTDDDGRKDTDTKPDPTANGSKDTAPMTWMKLIVSVGLLIGGILVSLSSFALLFTDGAAMTGRLFIGVALLGASSFMLKNQ